MRNPENSSVNPNTGDVTYKGPLSLEKGNHSHMPSKTTAYQSNDIRFHVNASSLGGVNNRSNVVAGHNDVDKGAWSAVEKGERTALQNGATIESEKTAVVNSQPGDRPSTFTVNDSITYPAGQTESIHLSVPIERAAGRAGGSDMAAAVLGTFDGPNPGDGLRGSMDSESYASLMESTDAELPGLDADYAPADFSGTPAADVASDAIGVDVGSDTGTGDCSADSGGADAGGGDGGASADAD